jgi:SAM-dependent methyltransferase
VRGIELRRCRRCKTLFTAALPAPGEAESYDEYYDEDALDVPSFVHEQLDRLLAGFADARHTNRWLDVGFGQGALLRAAAAAGWDVTGTEVAPVPVAHLAAAGFDVHLRDVGDAGFDPGTFDVATMIEVLEHVAEPGKLLEATVAAMREGGRLYITTPNATGLSGRVLGTRWSVVSPPEHLQVFTVRGLRALLSRAGLKPLRIRTHGLNPYELAAAMRGRPDNTDRVATSYRLNGRLTSNPKGRVTKAVLNSALTTLRAGDTIKIDSVTLDQAKPPPPSRV